MKEILSQHHGHNVRVNIKPSIVWWYATHFGIGFTDAQRLIASPRMHAICVDVLRFAASRGAPSTAAAVRERLLDALDADS